MTRRRAAERGHARARASILIGARRRASIRVELAASSTSSRSPSTRLDPSGPLQLALVTSSAKGRDREEGECTGRCWEKMGNSRKTPSDRRTRAIPLGALPLQSLALYPRFLRAPPSEAPPRPGIVTDDITLRWMATGYMLRAESLPGSYWRWYLLIAVLYAVAAAAAATATTVVVLAAPAPRDRDAGVDRVVVPLIQHIKRERTRNLSLFEIIRQLILSINTRSDGYF